MRQIRDIPGTAKNVYIRPTKWETSFKGNFSEQLQCRSKINGQTPKFAGK